MSEVINYGHQIWNTWWSCGVLEWVWLWFQKVKGEGHRTRKWVGVTRYFRCFQILSFTLDLRADIVDVFVILNEQSVALFNELSEAENKTKYYDIQDTDVIVT